jgi:adhesin transport system membrane fusion protein
MSPSREESGAERHALRLVPTSRPARVLAKMGIGALVLSVVALAVVPWQQSVVGSGRVVAWSPTERQQNIEAPIEGRVVHWEVREGTRVRKGDLVAELSDNDPAIMERLEQERRAVLTRIEAARARMGSIDGRITALRASGANAGTATGERVRMARERVRASEQAVDAARAAKETARLNVERQRQLSNSGLVSRRQLEVAELEYTRAGTEAERAEAGLAAARNEERALLADQAKVGTDAQAAVNDAQAARATADAEAANAFAELARIDVRLARQDAQRVMAPMDGTILRLGGAVGGEMVKAGDVLAVIVPDTESRAVELWMDGNDVPLLSEGRKVRLQFEGWPALQFSGWPSVAVGTFGAEVVLIDATDDGKGRFRVVALPDEEDEAWPPGRFLRQGVRVNGWVLLDQVKLGFELWRRLNGFPPTTDVGGGTGKGAGGKS